VPIADKTAEGYNIFHTHGQAWFSKFELIPPPWRRLHRHRSSNLVFDLVALALELGACLGVTVVEALLHGVHDVLQLAHLALVLGADESALRLKLTHQSALFLTVLQTQMLDPLALQIYSIHQQRENDLSVKL